MNLLRYIVIVLSVLLSSEIARSESLQMGVSVDNIPVESDFDGTELVIFGSIEGYEQAPLYRGEYDVVITVEGAREDILVRRKERVFGIWINNDAREYKEVPSFYSVLSRNPLDDIADKKTLQEVGIGVDNLRVYYDPDHPFIFESESGVFSGALRRVRRQKDLFAENVQGLEQLSPSLFRATVYLPPNVPIGQHKVTSYLFRDGKLLATNESGFRIQKAGLERFLYNLAHENSFLYGIMAVLIAIATGWTANLLFRKS